MLDIWITSPNIVAARRKIGPTIPTTDEVSMLGWANSLNATDHSMVESVNYNVIGIHPFKLYLIKGCDVLDNHNTN